MKFHENQGNFEQKFSIGAEIKSIRGIKNFNLDLKTLYSPILVNMAPSQTDGTEIGQKLILKPISR